MRVGGQRQLVVPPRMGYGEDGYRKLVRPGETLVYVIELESIS
jgi:peptidylprolyl isomerase